MYFIALCSVYGEMTTHSVPFTQQNSVVVNLCVTNVTMFETQKAQASVASSPYFLEIEKNVKMLMSNNESV